MKILKWKIEEKTENEPEFSSTQLTESRLEFRFILESIELRLTRSLSSTGDSDLRNHNTAKPEAKMSLTRASGSAAMMNIAGKRA